MVEKTLLLLSNESVICGSPWLVDGNLTSVPSIMAGLNGDGSLERWSRDEVHECRLDIAGGGRGTARLGLLRRTFGPWREMAGPGAVEAVVEGTERVTAMAYRSPSERISDCFW